MLEARNLLAERLGPQNDFGRQLEDERLDGIANYLGVQSFHSVEQCAEIARAGANALRRAARQGPSASTPDPYVSPTRIAELGAAPTSHWDLSRLVRVCEELNSVFAAGNYLATAMILRAIVDHVPPIFGVTTFSQHAASVGRSVKASLQALDTSSRNISDRWLHDQIKRKETLPSEIQVDFRQQLDVLLGEVLARVRGMTTDAGP